MINSTIVSSRVLSDADYAGDKVDMLHTKSTSGGSVAITGPNTFFPVGLLLEAARLDGDVDAGGRVNCDV